MDVAQYKKYLTPKNVAVSLVVVIIVVIVLLNILARKEEQAPSVEAPSVEAPLAVKQPDCIYTPGLGKQTYKIMTDKLNTLQITQIDVDPIDVREGQTQIITVKVKDKNNNATTDGTVISANISTDSKNTAAAAFTLLNHEQDPKDKSSLLSTWESSWTREGVICRVYTETIIATNNNGDESKIDLSFK